MRIQALIAAAALMAATGAAAQTAQSLGAPPGDSGSGKKLYMEQLCYTCHGTVRQGGDRGSGPRIYPNPYPYAAWVVQIRKPRQVMPPYAEKHVSDQDLA